MDKQDKPVVATCLVAVGILLGLGAASTHAQTADTKGRVGIHFLSHHTASQAVSGEKYNNFNPGIYRIEASGLTYGVYYNSYRKVSPHVGMSWFTPATPAEWQFGAYAGIAAGYCDVWRGCVVPLLSANVAPPEVFGTRVRLNIGPAGKRNTLFHISADWRF